MAVSNVSLHGHHEDVEDVEDAGLPLTRVQHQGRDGRPLEREPRRGRGFESPRRHRHAHRYMAGLLLCFGSATYTGAWRRVAGSTRIRYYPGPAPQILSRPFAPNEPK